MRKLWNQFLDWICSRIGICIRLDGDLLTPESPDDPWWYREVWK